MNMSAKRTSIEERHLSALDDQLAQLWETILSRSSLVRCIQGGDFDARLFAIYMMETYHYTRHNARNQALVGVRHLDLNIRYMKFCFEHAAEESGHELMALHDAISLGLPKDVTVPEPMSETDVLIAYLYWISANGNPLQRLGYSYWAENVYAYVMPLLRTLQSKLKLKDSQLSFFISHARIDEDHAEEVRRMLLQHCKNPEDWTAVAKVMKTSLLLTEQFLNGIYEEFERVRSGQASAYSFLSDHLSA